jgi:hypothetical protein
MASFSVFTITATEYVRTVRSHLTPIERRVCSMLTPGVAPVRLIVLDSSDRLIGYSNEIFSKHSIICSADRKCVGYRHSDNTILEFARSTPYIGPVVTSGESAGLWRERDDQINIEARKPKVSEFGIANYQLAMRSNPFSFVIAIVGLLMGMSLSLFWHWVIRSRQGVIFRLLGSIITLGVECVLIVWGFFYLFIIGEFSFIRWLISLCLGAMSGIAMVNLVLRKTKPTAVSS